MHAGAHYLWPIGWAKVQARGHFPISYKHTLQRPNGHLLAARGVKWNIVCVP
jgi:hypothetical protein